MFIELVDALRCPRPHEESWLVASTERMEARQIVEGTLGCPVCHAEYPVCAGVVDLSGGVRWPAAAPRSSSAGDAVRLAALLDLSDAMGFAVLLGDWGSHASSLQALVDCPLVLVDPPDDVGAGPGVSILRTAGEIPIASGAARAIAIDVGNLPGDHGQRVASAVRATRAGGRIVGPATLPLPDGARELARDRDGWVAEREASPLPLVTLHVRRGARG
jgi:uncharacterized protein YbaR (Trm112 family)